MANPSRDACVVALEDGTDVVLVDITPSELINAARDVGAGVPAAVAGIKVTRAALRQSIRKVGAQDVSYADLDAAGMARLVPRTRDVMRLSKVFTQRHSPTEAEIDAVMASLVCVADGDSQRWTVKVPGDKVRVIEFAEVDPVTVEQALTEATLSAKSETARGIHSLISGCSRSIRVVDGTPVTHDDLKGKGWDARFSVRETHILGHVYNYIHGTDGEPVGEVLPVPR